MASNVTVPNVRHGTPSTTHRRIGHWLHWATTAIGMLTAAASLAALGGAWHWTLDLFSHFRVQYVLVLLVVVVVMLAGRWWKSLVVWLAVLAGNAAFLVPLYLPVSAHHKATPGQSPSLTLLHYNVHFARSDPTELARWIDAQEADLIFLQEVTPQMLEAVVPLLVRYRLLAADPRWGAWGIVALYAADSQVSVTSSRVMEPTRGRPVVEVIAEVRADRFWC